MKREKRRKREKKSQNTSNQFRTIDRMFRMDIHLLWSKLWHVLVRPIIVSIHEHSNDQRWNWIWMSEWMRFEFVVFAFSFVVWRENINPCEKFVFSLLIAIFSDNWTKLEDSYSHHPKRNLKTKQKTIRWIEKDKKKTKIFRSAHSLHSLLVNVPA